MCTASSDGSNTQVRFNLCQVLPKNWDLKRDLKISNTILIIGTIFDCIQTFLYFWESLGFKI